MANATNQTLEIVSDILSDFHGRQYADPIGRDTLFFCDLGLASIDAIVLGEILDAYFKTRLPFGDLFAELGGRTDRDMTIGELVDFVDRNLPTAA